MLPVIVSTHQCESRLRADVEMLATTIGERHIWRAQSLQPAADHIRSSLFAAGYDPRTESYDVYRIRVDNIEAVRPGSSLAREIVVVGAHYDSVAGSPGANDNATGIAAVLELARRFAGVATSRTIHFVAFVNEEPPFFQTSQMGSVVYANAARARGDDIVAMLSLETLGYYSDEAGSQIYPVELGEGFPDRGNFIGMVSNLESAQLLERVRSAFAARTPFPVEAAPAPAGLPGVGWSDQWSFWQAGYPGVMITDTAPFRYPWYHQAGDTPDKIDFQKFAIVVDGIEAAVAALAS
jgi:Zn-dependent M28 family amino/carboxypeptidase